MRKHRSTVMGTAGMCASGHPLISAAGIKVLDQGGNAADAAIAMALVSTIVLPDMVSIGGDAFLLHYNHVTQRVTAIQGNSSAPKGLTIDYLKTQGCQRMPYEGMWSVSVPSCLQVYQECLKRYGTGKLSDFIDEAITLAESGFPVGSRVVHHMHTDLKKLQSHSGTGSLYLKDGKPYQEGELLKNPDLAKTYQKIKEQGIECFYQGEIADQIIQYSNKHGGLFTKEDLKQNLVQTPDPLFLEYRNKRLWQMAPPSVGFVHLAEMNILGQFDMSAMDWGSSERLHTMISAKRLAFYQRSHYFGDPDYHQNPLSEVLGSAFAQASAKKIRASKQIDPEDDPLLHQDAHTTSFVVIDHSGDAVSFIHSIAGTWGSGEVVDYTGILLNNRASTYSFDPNHPNALLPGHKMLHTLNAWMITDSQNHLYALGNTPGGDNQPQWNMQVVSNLLDYGMDPQTAVEAMKWSDHRLKVKDRYQHVVFMERGFPRESIQALKQSGYQIKMKDAYGLTGASQVIVIDENQVRKGGSDPRADGCVIAQVK
jgi:gamma-glutamyltranspeptidase/glutathione hydrolase